MFKTILLFVIAVTGANASCSSCASGRTCPTTGGSMCIPCVAGKFRLQSGSTNMQCLDCPTGFAGPTTARTACQTCVQGKYQSELAETECLSCAAGQYSAQNAQSVCTNCPSGKYGDQVRQVSPTSCKQCKLKSIYPLTALPSRSFAYRTETLTLTCCVVFSL